MWKCGCGVWSRKGDPCPQCRKPENFGPEDEEMVEGKVETPPEVCFLSSCLSRFGWEASGFLFPYVACAHRREGDQPDANRGNRAEKPIQFVE